MVTSHCAHVHPGGRACRACPVRDSRFCFWHEPGRAEDVADAQRLGGMRRRKERSLAVAYDFSGLGTIESIRRLVEIAATNALGLETSIAKIRALVQVGVAAMKLLGRLSRGHGPGESARHVPSGRAGAPDPGSSFRRGRGR